MRTRAVTDMRAHSLGADTATAALLRLTLLSRTAEFKARRKHSRRGETATFRPRLNIRLAGRELLRLTAGLPRFSELGSENCVGDPPSADMSHPSLKTPTHSQQCAQQGLEAGADADDTPVAGGRCERGDEAAGGGDALWFGNGAGWDDDPWSGLPEVGALPYHWQMRRPDAAWESVPAPAQEILERVFCNPDNDRAELRTQSGTLSLDFATMEASNPSGERLDARRLESSRYSPYPYRFYRKEQNRWLRLDQTATSIVTSSVAAGFFNLGQWPLMKMRPEFMSSVAVSQLRDAPTPTTNTTTATATTTTAAGGSTACRSGLPPSPGWPDVAGCAQPPTWVPMDPGADFVRVTLNPEERAFRAAYRLFHQTVSETKALVLGIERVQNPFLWEKYCRKKTFLSRKLPEMPERELELHLFHGTACGTVPAICKHNFDPRLSGKHAAVYGHGSYFATAASFSHGYASGPGGAPGERFVFVAKVLAGRRAAGRPGLRRPPPLRPGDMAGDLYDSCVDDEARPSIFAIFDSDQCYPYFLIRYRVIGNEVRLWDG